MSLHACRMSKTADEKITFIGFGMSENEAVQDALNQAVKIFPDLNVEDFTATTHLVKGHPARFAERVRAENEAKAKERENAELPPPRKGRES